MQPTPPFASFIGTGLNWFDHTLIHFWPGVMEFEFTARRLPPYLSRFHRQVGGEVRVNHYLLLPGLATVLLRDGSGLPLDSSVSFSQSQLLERAIAEAGFTLVVKRRILLGRME